MGLHGQTAWSLEEVVQLIRTIHSCFTPPYTIVIYSLYSMGEVQRALAAAEGKQANGKDKLQVTKFVMVKVSSRRCCL